VTNGASLRRARITDRWPTAAAIVVGVGGIVLIAVLDREVEFFGPVVVMMAGIYLMAFALGRPWTVWIALAVLSTVASVLLVLDGLDVLPASPAVGMSIIVVVLWLWTVAQRRFRDARTFSLQTAGMVVFGAATLVCAVIAPRWGILLAGVGFLVHGVWDACHFRAKKVVHRSYAEFCGVVDLVVGTALIVAALV
jgi:hypothetical protein